MAHDNHRDDMEWANEQFKATVWPNMKHIIHDGDGDIFSVENNDDILYENLDMKCGIDYMHINGYRMNGIAVRIQLTDLFNGSYRPYNTFTIRDARSSGADTEYKKRLDQILNNDIYPRYTLQAYITNDKTNPAFLSGAIMRTKDLYITAEYLDNEINPEFKGKWWFKDNKGRYSDGSTFRVIPWTTLQEMVYAEYDNPRPIKIVIST